MGTVIVVIGIVICLFSLAIIIFGKKKGSGASLSGYGLNELELEFRDLKNEILELTREFNRTASYNTNVLDEKIAYISEIREDVDNKMLKLTKLMTDIEIMYGRYEKNIKGTPQQSIIKPVQNKFDNYLEDEIPVVKETEKKNENRKGDVFSVIRERTIEESDIQEKRRGPNDEILDMLDMGMSTSEISIKTGKSIGEIEFIIGLMRKR